MNDDDKKRSTVTFTRTIVYKGTKNWIVNVLHSSLSIGEHNFGNGSITISQDELKEDEHPTRSDSFS